MPTPTRTEYVTLGALMGGSRAVDCFDWYELMGIAPRRTEPYLAPGFAGVVPRASVEDALEAKTKWRLDGRFDQDNVEQVESTWRANLYTHIAALRAVCEVGSTQTVQLTRPGGGPHSASCQVLEVHGPKETASPYVVEFAVVLLLPNGALL